MTLTPPGGTSSRHSGSLPWPPADGYSRAGPPRGAVRVARAGAALDPALATQTAPRLGLGDGRGADDSHSARRASVRIHSVQGGADGPRLRCGVSPRLRAARLRRDRPAGTPAGPRQRVLRADAATGQVHAVRVRIGAPIWKRYEKRGDKPGTIKAEHTHWLEVSPVEGGVPLQISAMYPAGGGTGLTRTTTDLLQAGLQLACRQAWLCLPTRWKMIEKELPAALVVDTGHVVWGELSRDAARQYLADRISGAPRLSQPHLSRPPEPRPARPREVPPGSARTPTRLVARRVHVGRTSPDRRRARLPGLVALPRLGGGRGRLRPGRHTPRHRTAGRDRLDDP